MNYTRNEQIEILEGKILDCKTNIQRAHSEEQRAKVRIELRRAEEEIKFIKFLKELNN